MSEPRQRDRPVSGMWFEELTEGLVVRHAITRTVTESDNVMFTCMTMNPAPCTSTRTTRRRASSGR